MTKFHFIRPEQLTVDCIPLCQSLGIGCGDISNCFLFSRASVEVTSNALKQLFGFDIQIHNAYDSEVQVGKCLVLILQFVGHNWSLIYKPAIYRQGLENTRKEFAPFFSSQDALGLSQMLCQEVLFFASSDTTGDVIYQLFRNGDTLEDFSCTEEDSETGAADPIVQFQSKVRKVDILDIKKSPPHFVKDFLLDHRVYVPAFVQIEDLVIGETIPLKIPSLSADDLIGIEYLARS